MSKARAEFLEFLIEISGTHGFAIDGLRALRRELESESQRINIANGNTLQFGWTQDDPDTPGTIPFRAAWRPDQFTRNLAPGGISDIYLGWGWITLVYDRWEDDYRHRFASEMKCSHSMVRCDALGDLRHLRHDVTHSKGIATRQQAGKCKLLTEWFTIGRQIVIDADRIRYFYDVIFTAERAFYVGANSTQDLGG